MTDKRLAGALQRARVDGDIDVAALCFAYHDVQRLKALVARSMIQRKYPLKQREQFALEAEEDTDQRLVFLCMSMTDGRLASEALQAQYHEWLSAAANNSEGLGLCMAQFALSADTIDIDEHYGDSMTEEELLAAEQKEAATGAQPVSRSSQSRSRRVARRPSCPSAARTSRWLTSSGFPGGSA